MAGKGEPLLEREFMTIPEIHAVPEEEFQKWPLRKRYRKYFEAGTEANHTLPVFLIISLHIVFGVMWFSVFYYLVMDRSEEMWSLLNMRKFVLYNVLHGVLGFGATCGPLAFKNSVPVAASLLQFSTCGSLCSPLLPGLVACFQKTPGKRSIVAVLAYFIYVAALVWAIIHPSTHRVMLANAALALASIFDFVIFFASRGEHYGYMMFCMMFPDWIAGCQCVQFMLWIVVGFSKVGPWFKYVIQVLAKDALWTPCLPKHTLAKIFNKDWPRDYSPSWLSRALGHLGAIGEWFFPLCCALGSPGTIWNDIGVYGMICYHAFIWCTLPTASVFEWQYYTQIMTYFLYKRNTFALPTSPILIAFLVLVLSVIPIIGQLEPTLVPFLMAYRQYAGNWRLGWWVIRKSARPKVEKIKTWNSIFHWEAAPPEFGGERMEYTVASAFLAVPQMRGIFSVMEKFFDDNGYDPNDFYFINSFAMSNAVFGWDLAVGWLWFRECFRNAVLDICGFEPGECYVLQVEPVKNLPPHNMQYRFMDYTKGPLDAEIVVDIPYSALEGSHPCEVYLKPEDMKKGKSIRGTFLSTYY